METERLVLRRFGSRDWPEVLQPALDWKATPGSELDKLPTTEAACKQFTDCPSSSGLYLAVCLRSENKVVGLLALNGLDERELGASYLRSAEAAAGLYDQAASHMPWIGSHEERLARGRPARPGRRAGSLR